MKIRKRKTIKSKHRIPTVCSIRGKTTAQRRACHKALTGSSKLPPRGMGRGRGLRRR